MSNSQGVTAKVETYRRARGDIDILVTFELLKEQHSRTQVRVVGYGVFQRNAAQPRDGTEASQQELGTDRMLVTTAEAGEMKRRLVSLGFKKG